MCKYICKSVLYYHISPHKFLLQRQLASYREAGPLTQTPGLSQRGRPLTQGLFLSNGCIYDRLSTQIWWTWNSLGRRTCSETVERRTRLLVVIRHLLNGDRCIIDVVCA